MEGALGVKDPLEIFQSTLLALEHVYVCLSCQWGKNSNEILVFIHLGSRKSWLNIPIWSWEHLCENENFFVLIEICTWKITIHRRTNFSIRAQTGQEPVTKPRTNSDMYGAL